MTQQELDQRLEALRKAYKVETDPVKRKIIEKRALLLKKTKVYITPTQIKEEI